ncbi:MAG: hypothetical protein M0R77_02180 [Gammaproteobacteria bacterium]|nr:hypothetical protein [Gammaproteobacteria bacterium]
MADPTPILGTNVASAIVPFTDADIFPTHHAKYGKGGWRGVPTYDDLALIPVDRLDDGMAVFVVETSVVYTWNETAGTWDYFTKGGDITSKRVTVEYTVTNLVAGETQSFELAMAKSSIIYDLTLSKVAKVTAWSTPDKDETNPYIFSATEDHLTDDGSTVLSDGSILRNRRYSIFVNLEDPPTNKIYFDMENIDFQPGDVTITITYLPVEYDQVF